MAGTVRPEILRHLTNNKDDTLATFAAIRLLSCCWTIVPGANPAYNHISTNIISALDMQLRYSASESLVQQYPCARIYEDETSRYQAQRAGYPGKSSFPAATSFEYGYDGHVAESPERSSPQHDEEGKAAERPSRMAFLDNAITRRRQSASNLPFSRQSTKLQNPNQSTSALIDSQKVKSLDDGNNPSPSSNLDQILEHPGRESSESNITCPAELGRSRREGSTVGSPASLTQQQIEFQQATGTWRGAFHKFRQKVRRSKSISLPTTSSSDSYQQDPKDRRRANRDRLTEPAPGGPLFRPWSCARLPSLDLIAIAGMMIAAGELDRLSFLADDMAKSKNKKQHATATHNEQVLTNDLLSPASVTSPVSGVPPNTPNTATGGGTPASPMPGGDGTGLSRSVLSLSSRQGDFVPFPPANTPIFTRSGTSSPVTGTSTPSRPGAGLFGTSPVKQRAAGPSKLSEVYNFEEAARRLSRSDSPTLRPQEKEEEPVYRLESFPEFPDRGDTSSTYTSGESTPRHRPGAHYFVATDLATAGVSGLKPKGHADCEQLEGRKLGEGIEKEKEKETHAVDCKLDTWAPEDGEPGDGEPFCPRDSQGSRLCFATAADRRKSWLDIARRATKGRWDHELEECEALTTVEGEATENEQVVTKRKHTIADIVELLKMGKAMQKGSD